MKVFELLTEVRYYRTKLTLITLILSSLLFALIRSSDDNQIATPIVSNVEVEQSPIDATTPKKAQKSNDTPEIIRIKVKPIGYLNKIFRDMNNVQLVAANEYGIKPLTKNQTVKDANKQLVKIKTCDEYILKELTHSEPYLRPNAAKLLKDIGRNFTDTIRARSGGLEYKMIVTSLLRTPESVKALQKSNSNSTTDSAHLYGTTFDISYAKFFTEETEKNINDEDLKNILGEIIKDMRSDELCYVRYEVKQGCFHVTSRR